MNRLLAAAADQQSPGSGGTTTYFEEDFTTTTTGNLSTDNTSVSENGAWAGTGLTNFAYQGDGSGIQCTAAGGEYAIHNTLSRLDVQVTCHFTLAYGTSANRTNGRVVLRSTGTVSTDGLIALWSGSGTDFNLELLDVSGPTTLKTWDVSALAEQVDAGDVLELVMRCSGNDIIFYSLRVNGGALHTVNDSHTVASTPHGSGGSGYYYGIGNLERVASSTNDRTTYYKVESIA